MIRGDAVDMPTYHYRCSDCGHEFEKFQKFSEDPLTDCPSCEGRVRRVIQPVGVVFKGSGWYITDSRASNNGSGNGKSDKSESKSDASSSSSSDAGKSADKSSSSEKVAASA